MAGILGFCLLTPAQAVTVRVVDDSGADVANGFRWLLEQDNSYGIKKTARDGQWAGQPGGPQLPGTPSPDAPYDPTPGASNPTYTLGVNLHHSHAPVVCSGDTNSGGTLPGQGTGVATVDIDATTCPGYQADQNYVLSVLPWHTSAPGTPATAQTGYQMGGRDLSPADAGEVTLVVHKLPQPTAQITVLTFEDNQSINGAYDQPAEHGLSNFQLVVSDPAGQLTQDAWANQLGTTYKYACSMPDGRPAAGIRNADGSVTCDSPAVALTPEQQPLYELDAEGVPVVEWQGDGNLYTCPGPTGGVDPIAGYTPYQLHNCIDPYTLIPLYPDPLGCRRSGGPLPGAGQIWHRAASAGQRSGMQSEPTIL